jgi:phage terminase large subunit
MILTKKQTKALDLLEDNHTRQIVFGGGAGSAKSFLGCYWILKNCLKYPGTRWLVGRAVLKTLKDTTLNSFFDVCTHQGIKAGVHYSYNAQSNIITFYNKSVILLKDLEQYPSDPNFDELGSLEITGAFVDEVNQISEKAWNIVRSRIRYKLDEFGLIPKMLGTCNPDKGFIYQNFYKPAKEGTIDSEKAFVQALVTDNPFISQYYIENLKSLDRISKERLLYGNWEYNNNDLALIEYDAITDLYTNEHAQGGKMYITADIARYGADKSVICIWNGFRCEQIIVKAKNSITEIADFIKATASVKGIPMSSVVVDEDGVGGGCKDILNCKGFVNNSKAIKGNYQNLKSECYYMLAEKINKREMFVMADIEVKKQLNEELEYVWRHNPDKDGKLAVMPKDKVKEKLGRSPDIADALMMRMYFDLRGFEFVAF